MGWGGFLDNVTGHFSTSEFRKRRRIKLESLKDKKKELMRRPATVKLSKKIEKIQAEIAELERKLQA